MTLDQLRSAALALDPKQRESLAEELLFSINESDSAKIDAAWLAEARRRDADLAADRTHLVPIDEALQRISNRPRP